MLKSIFKKLTVSRERPDFIKPSFQNQSAEYLLPSLLIHTSQTKSERFVIESLVGQETLSNLYEFEVTILSANSSLAITNFIGQEALVSVDTNTTSRYYHGIIGEIYQGRTEVKNKKLTTHYIARIYPKIWLLKSSQNHRIFQDQSVMEIIKTVFDENKIHNVRFEVQRRGKEKRNYCVQYGESNFDFISRLMQEEGIFYTFTHDKSGHTLILADSQAAYFPIGSKDKVPLMTETDIIPHRFPPNTIQECHFGVQIGPQKVHLRDYDYMAPNVPLKAHAEGAGRGGEIYRYPGNFTTPAKGATYADQWLESAEIQNQVMKGTGTVSVFVPGAHFQLTDHPCPNYNKNYVVYSVEHRAFLDESQDPKNQLLYENTFEGFAKEKVFRPQPLTPKPKIYGAQTATVTGKNGEEVCTDELGRIKVLFHWDRWGTADDNSSCWIRVAQGWTGNDWGMVFTPRVGQEVIVQFLEGDPDRPIVTGCVYNGQNSAPENVKSPTKSIIKSRSSPQSSGFHEISFEDKKDNEKLYVHAEKDAEIEIEENRHTYLHHGSDHLTIERGDRNVCLEGKSQGERDVTGSGNDTLEIKKGNKHISLDEGDFETVLKQGNLTIKIDKGNQSIEIKGNQSTSVGGNCDFDTKGNVDQTVGGKYQLKITGDFDINVTGKFKVDAMGGFEMKTMAQGEIEAMGGLDISSLGPLSLSSKAEAKLEGTAAVNVSSVGPAEVSGLQTSIKANTQLELNGAAMTDIQGGAMVQIQGGIVKVN